MKELSIEQKAKAYDEAIKYGQYLINERCKEGTDGSFHRADLDKMFPELAESEDEKAINAIKKLVYLADGNQQVNSEQYNLIMTWLKRQGEQKPVEPQQDMLSQEQYAKAVDECIYGEQNPAWNEEDDAKLKSILFHIEDVENKDVIDWLKSLKERRLPQQKQEWSDEEKKMLGYAIKAVHTMYVDKHHSCITDIYVKTANWLKSLRPQPKQEWTEEDEEKINKLLQFVQNIEDFQAIPNHYKQYKDMLKSLRPQKQWKPTEAMLEALYRAVPQNVMEISEDEILLGKLYQGLKYGRVLSNK